MQNISLRVVDSHWATARTVTKGSETVNRKSIRNTAEVLSRTIDRCKSDDPLLMRKSIRMEDTFYRKNSPDEDIVKLEFGMEAEHYVIVAAAVALGALVMWKIARAARRSAEKRRIKQKMCRKAN